MRSGELKHPLPAYTLNRQAGGGREYWTRLVAPTLLRPGSVGTAIRTPPFQFLYPCGNVTYVWNVTYVLRLLI